MGTIVDLIRLFARGESRRFADVREGAIEFLQHLTDLWGRDPLTRLRAGEVAAVLTRAGAGGPGDLARDPGFAALAGRPDVLAACHRFLRENV
jgi:hypothetical protein